MAMDAEKLEALLAGAESFMAMAPQVASAVDGINAHLEKLGERSERVRVETKKSHEAVKDYEKGLTGLNKKLREEVETYNAVFQAQQKTYDATKKYVELTAKGNMFGFNAGARRDANIAAGTGMGLTGPRGLVGTAKSAMGTIASALPMGGLLGLVFYGQKRESEFASKGAQAARLFDRIGGAGAKTAGMLSGQIRGLSKTLGLELGAQTLLPTLTAFRNFGIAGEAFRDMAGNIAPASKQIHTLATGADLLMKADLGTTGQLIGQSFQFSGQSVQEAADQVLNLAHAASKAGINYQLLAQTMTQSSSALRMQRQEVGDLAKGFFALRRGLGQGTLAGANQRTINAAAMQGIQALAGGIGGMNEGLMGYVGQRIGARTGKNFSGVQAIIAMQEGRAGKTGGHFGEVVKELRSIAEGEVGSNKDAQKYFLQKVSGMSPEAARAAVEMDLEGLERELGDPQKALLKGFEKEAAAQDKWRLMQEKIMLDVADMGKGVLKILIGIGLSISAIAKWLMAWSSGDRSAMSKSIAQLGAAGSMLEAGATDVASGAMGAFKHVKEGLGIDGIIRQYNNAKGSAKPVGADALDRILGISNDPSQLPVGTPAARAAGQKLFHDDLTEGERNAFGTMSQATVTRLQNAYASAYDAAYTEVSQDTTGKYGLTTPHAAGKRAARKAIMKQIVHVPDSHGGQVAVQVTATSLGNIVVVEKKSP